MELRSRSFNFVDLRRLTGTRGLLSVHSGLCWSCADVESAEKVFDLPVVRIIVTDLPQYLAVVSRVRVESQTLGPAGGLLSSTVVPQAQVVFPHDAIVKPIRVGLQVN